MDESALARVEVQRAELEVNITKLKKALRHWQALEIDYQGLSEEFVARPENLSKTEALKIAQSYGANIVDEKELRELLNYNKGTPRRPEQIIELLSKRVDYVNRNVDTIKKQLSDAQKKLNALLLAEQPGFRDDAGLPLMEITEELDEEGNVVSGKVQKSDETSPNLTKVLEKAGVRDVEEMDGKVVARVPRNEKAVVISPLTDSFNVSANAPLGDLESPPRKVNVQAMATESAIPQTSTTLATESAEEAAFRAEMLQYHEGLGEVGAIVAELDLEDVDMSNGEDEYDDISIDSDYDEDDDLQDESEDEKGMSRSSLQSEAYLRKMKLLEKKHGITGMSNVGPKPTLPDEVKTQIDRPPPAEAARKAALARAEAAARSEGSARKVDDEPAKSKAKKKVAFANTLDIAPENGPANKKSEDTPKAPIVATTKPFKQDIVERPVKQSLEDDAGRPKKKVSRFKAARTEMPQTPMFAPEAFIPTTSTESDTTRPGPIGKIYEPNIIEHPRIENAAPPPGVDDFGIDDVMHQREIATEYHQLRNRMIQRQGGFVHEGEQNNWGDATAPLSVEDDAGNARKVSRFKAARMK